MQLDRLQMRNFRRYRNQEIRFKDGITGILGNNGTGKSTIVDAILFCLFGVKETGLEYLISATAGTRDKAEVRLDFSVRGEDYQVVRTLDQKKKHDVEMYKAKKLLARGVSDVQDALRRVVRMGHADFRHTVFSGQKELLTLVEAPPEQRKGWFRRVLGIDSLKEAGGGILRDQVRTAQDEVLQINGRLDGSDPDEIKRELDETGRSISAAELEIRRLEDEERTLKRALATLQREEKGLREREKKDHSTRSLIKAREEQAGEIEKELGEIGGILAALEGHRQEFQGLLAIEAGFEALQDRYTAGKERARTFQELTAREAERRERICEREEERERLREEDERLGHDEETIRALAPLVARRSEIQESLARFRGKEAHYRDVAAEVERKKATLDELVRRGGVLRSRIDRMRDARSHLESLAREARVPEDRWGEPVPVLEARRQDLLEAIAGRKAAKEQAARRIEELADGLATLKAGGLEGVCPTCRQPLGMRFQDLVDEREEDIRELRKTVSGLEAECRDAEKHLTALMSTLDEARRLQEACSHLEEDSAEWKEVQDQTLREISLKEHLEQEMASIGYDPRECQMQEKEYASLEVPWKENLAASERVKGRQEVRRKMKYLAEGMERLRGEAAAIAREREGLRFDPKLHRQLEEEYGKAEWRHRRYLELKPEIDRVPVLLGQEKDLNARAGTITQTLGDLRADLGALGFSPADLRRVEEASRENSEKALEVGRQVERSRAEKARLEGEKVRLTETLARMENDRKEHDRLIEEIRMLELTRDQLNGFTDHLLGVVRDQIQDETGRILSEITDGRYDTVILDDNFELLVHDLGGDFPVSRFSGGEQDDVAIALRIALSRYIAEMHELHDSTFLIFDEIFGSQDEERRGNIFRALRTLEPYFPQIFLISHVSEVQGEFGNTLVVEAVSESESCIRDMEEAEA
jgi:exonuclease SbcC